MTKTERILERYAQWRKWMVAYRCRQRKEQKALKAYLKGDRIPER